MSLTLCRFSALPYAAQLKSAIGALMVDVHDVACPGVILLTGGLLQIGFEVCSVLQLTWTNLEGQFFPYI
jgi:hypothetical protein